MASYMMKIISLVLIYAILSGGMQLPMQPIDLSTSATGPTSTATEPSATLPEPTEPQPTQPDADPEPLPPSSGYTTQLSLSQKPAKPNVAVPKLSAKNFFIYDTRISEFLYINCDADTAIYPASTTKLFTSYVALQYLSPDDIVTVGKELSYVAYDASVAGFQRGDRVSAEALVYGALLPSGCDASYILAAAAGRVILGNENATAKNAISAFMDECNRLAKELGMENTYLVTPDGYHHADHKISMEAFVIIANCCLENALIKKVTTSAEATVTYTNSRGKACTLLFRNTNLTIQPESEYYNVHSIGLKTGFTNAAGYCLLTAYNIDDRYIIVGIFGSRSSSDRFKDTNKLFNAYLPHL